MSIQFLNTGSFPDNAKLNFGGAPDFEIYHNSTTNQNFINSLLGRQLVLSSDAIYFQNPAQDEYLASFIANGAVKLYYDNVVKFETYSTGAGVTGNLYFTSGSKIHFDNGVSNDYYIEKSGTALTFNTGGTYAFNTGDVTFAGNATVAGDVLINNGQISTIDSTGSLYIDVNVDNAYGGRNFRVSNNGTTQFNIDSTNKAEFFGDVSIPAGGKYHTYTGSDNYITYNSWYIWTGSDIIIRNSSTGPFKFQTNGANDVLTLDSSQEATFHGDILTNTDSSSDIGKTATRWANLWVDSINGDTYSGPYLPLAGGTMTGNVIFNDGVSALFGTSSDMTIKHDGSNSKIENNTGHLYFIQEANDKNIYLQTDDGSGSTTTYIKCDGLQNFTEFPVAARFMDDVKLQFGDANDSDIYHNGTDMIIRNHAAAGDMNFAADSTGSGGAATSYFWLDGGVVKTRVAKGMNFEDNVKATFGNVVTPDLDIYSDGNNGVISTNGASGSLYITQNVDDEDIYFQADDGSGGATTYFFLDGSQTNIHCQVDFRIYDSKKLQLGNGADGEFYHDGSDLYMTNTTGDMYLINKADDKDIIFQSDDGSGGYTTYFQLDGGEGRTVFKQNAIWEDNKAIYMGNAADLRLYHNATDSHIDNYAGNLNIVNNTDDGNIQFYCDDGSGGVTPYLDLDGNGGVMNAYVELRFGDGIKTKYGSDQDLLIYHDGSNGFMVNNTGVLYIRNEADDNDICFQSDNGTGSTATYFFLDGDNVETTFLKRSHHMDSVEARFGDGNDLKIYHDGSNSYISETGTGNLYITASERIRFVATNGDALLYMNENSNVELYYDNSKKFETTTLGATIHGNLNLNDNGHLRFGADNDLDIYHDGTDSYINNNTGILNITNNDIRFKTTGAETMFRAVANGAVELMYDNSTKIATTNTGVTVTGGLTLSGKGTSAATVDGDGSTTMATKGWVESKLTGATLYQGTWDPSGGGYGSPDLSAAALQVNGYYYICSADGTAEPNGTGTEPDTWHTGDWVIWNDDVGSGEWQKIDNTTVLSGAGTGDYLARWTDTETLGDSIVLVSGNDILIPQYIRHTSDPSDDTYFGFSANDTFTVYTAGGEGLNIDSNRNVTFTGDITIGANYIGRDADNYINFATDNSIKFVTNASTRMQLDQSQFYPSNNDGVSLGVATLSWSDLFLADGAVINFDNGEVTMTHSGSGDFTIAAADDLRLEAGGEDIVLRGSSSTEFGRLTNVGGNFKISTTGYVNIDAADDITLDAGGNDIRLFSSGVEYGKFKSDSSDLALYSSIQDKDMIFRGNDGGSTIDALTLDMSEGGNATFAGTITTTGTLTVDSGHVNIDSGYSFQWGDTHERIEQSDGKIEFFTNNTEQMTLSGSNLGIGTTTPDAKLDVSGGIRAGGKITYTLDYAGGVTTTGNAVAGLSTGSNGHSAVFIFTCSGGGGYQRIVYSCRNESGTWNIDKDIDEGVNSFDVTYAADGSDNITFTFKSRSGTQGYWPKVTVEAIGNTIQTSYIN